MSLEQREAHDKLVKITQLSDAIVRHRRSRTGTYHDSLALQRLEKQRAELQGLLPPLRLVA